MLTKKQLEDVVRCEYTNCLDCSCFIEATGGCAVAKTALVYRAMLERLEWSLKQEILNNNQHHCPVCERNKQIGHRPGCKLAALLGEVEGE